MRSIAACSVSPRIGAPGEAQVLERGQPGQDAAALRHVADAEPAPVVRLHPRDVDAVDRDPAGGNRHQADQRFEKGGLADTVVADDPDRFARMKLERDAVQDRHVPVGGAQLEDLEHDIVAGRGDDVRGFRFDHFARLPM